MSVSYDKTSTLRSQTKHHEPLVLVYESHGQDCRYKPLGEVCSTVSQTYGTGGGNVPIVLESNQNHAVATDTEVCPCLPAAMGNGGLCADDS